jgi:hypothetical protein
MKKRKYERDISSKRWERRKWNVNKSDENF